MKFRVVLVSFAMLALGGCAAEDSIFAKDIDFTPQYLELFDKIDQDRRGQITRQQTLDYLAQLFNQLDTNHDGFLTEDEVQPVAGMIGSKSAADMVFRLDTNGDGKLSVKEFQRVAIYLFTRDANHDEILTRDEVAVSRLNRPAPGTRPGGNAHPGMVR